VCFDFLNTIFGLSLIDLHFMVTIRFAKNIFGLQQTILKWLQLNIDHKIWKETEKEENEKSFKKPFSLAFHSFSILVLMSPFTSFDIAYIIMVNVVIILNCFVF
jgi:hypothetical protein